MTTQEIRDRVHEIIGLMGDPEGQHGREDDLHLDVLRAIAAGAERPDLLATEALATTKLGFPRWCA